MEVNLNADLLKPMMTIKEVAAILNVHTNTARRWADAGIIPAYRISRRGDRRFVRTDIMRVLSEMRNNNGFLDGKNDSR
jgi:excisionase family DNA binding protein